MNNDGFIASYALGAAAAFIVLWAIASLVAPDSGQPVVYTVRPAKVVEDEEDGESITY